jgi:hypothetical protein
MCEGGARLRRLTGTSCLPLVVLIVIARPTSASLGGLDSALEGLAAFDLAASDVSSVWKSAV